MSRLLRKKRYGTYFAAICIAILSLPFATWIVRQASAAMRYPDLQYERGIQFIADVSEEVAGDEPTVFFGHIRTFCQSDLPFANLEHDDEFWNAASADSTVWLILALNRLGSSERYVESTKRLAEEFDADVRRQGTWEIYYRRFEAGRLRPVPTQP